MGKLPRKLFGQYRRWIEQYCWPVTAALSGGDIEAAAAAVAAAWEATTGDGLDERLSDSYEVACLWHEYLVASKREDVPFEQTVADFLERTRVPRRTDWGEQCRLKVDLSIRLTSSATGAEFITGDEIRDALDRIEDLESSAFIWHYITPWAFTHRDEELLKRAYEALVQDQQVQGQRRSFLRVGLLHSLVSGRATPELVKRYVQDINTLSALHEFLQYILPECESRGLADDVLRAMVESRHELLHSQQSDQGG